MINSIERKGPYSEDAIVSFRAELRGLKQRCRKLIADAGEIEEKLEAIQDKLHGSE
jgi:hypothetical protein